MCIPLFALFFFAVNLNLKKKKSFLVNASLWEFICFLVCLLMFLPSSLCFWVLLWKGWLDQQSEAQHLALKASDLLCLGFPLIIISAFKKYFFEVFINQHRLVLLQFSNCVQKEHILAAQNLSCYLCERHEWTHYIYNHTVPCHNTAFG